MKKVVLKFYDIPQNKNGQQIITRAGSLKLHAKNLTLIIYYYYHYIIVIIIII